MNQNFKDFMENYRGQKIAIAISGGLDSVCLLHWLIKSKFDVVALHVNHGLRAAADVETKYVADLCEKLNVPFEIMYWIGDKPATGLESAAREARYKLMTDYCKKNSIEYLAVAHQADDQIETFLMNLARGSGVYGLAAMRSESVRDEIKIIRPLLKVFRNELEKYCHDNKIKYFTDEMNSDEKYTRVKIRKNRNILSEKLGISDDRILLAIENLSRSRDVLEKQTLDLAEKMIKNDCALFQSSFLFDADPEIRLKLLSRLIQSIGESNYQPRLNSLQNALHKLGGDCKFTLGHCTLRRLGDEILIVAEGKSSSFRKLKWKNKIKK